MSDPLKDISLILTRIALPTIACVSFVGNILNIFVLSRNQLRKHACAIYFIALSANSLLYTSTILIVSVLGDAFQIKLTSQSIVVCKLVTYFGTVFSALSPSFIVLASVDRCCASSSILRLRNFSGAGVAKLMTIIVTVFFCLLFIISLVTVNTSANVAIGCRIQGDPMFVQAYGIFQFILFSCLAPFLMLVFGGITIFNVQKRRLVASTLRTNRRTETQLVRMLLLQVGVQVVLTMPLCMISLLLLFPSLYQPTATSYSIFYICRAIFQISYATPFFLYIISAQMFRRAFLQLIFMHLPRRFHNRIHVTENDGVQTFVHTRTLINESLV